MASSQLRSLPLPLRSTVVGAVIAAVLGAITGLVLGIRAHPATAWFAVFEVAIPAAVLGALLGLAVGTIASVVARSRTPRR